jgi:hypothetical protein
MSLRVGLFEIYKLISPSMKPFLGWYLQKYLINCTIQEPSCFQENINSGSPALCTGYMCIVLLALITMQ